MSKSIKSKIFDWTEKNAMILMAILAVRFFVVPDIPSDYFWHLKLGEYIWDTFSIPQKDTFSYFDLNVFCHSWLFGAITWPLHKIHPYIVSGLSSILFVICLMFIYRKCGWEKHKIAFFFIILASPLFLRSGFTERPQFISTFIYAILFFLLLSKSKKIYWALPISIVFLANVHGGSIILIQAFTGVILVGLCLNVIIYPELKTKQNIGHIYKLAISLFGSGICGMINPYGVGVYTYALKEMSHDTAFTYVVEWQNIYELFSADIVVSIALLGLTFAFLMLQKDRWDFSHLLLFGASAIIGINTSRCFQYFIYISIMLVGMYASEYKLPFERLARVGEFFQRMICLIAPLCILILGIGILCENYGNRKSFESQSTSEAINFLEEIGAYDGEYKVFNHYNFGALLIWNNYPVFVDSRADCYMKQFSPNLERDILNDSMLIDRMKNEEWREFWDAYPDIGWVYWMGDESSLMYIRLENDEDFKLVYADGDSFIYERVAVTRKL